MIDLPEQDELVIAIIKKILPYGAFCVLPEYENMEAFLHVSEVAPRWIKNIHEFISEGQTQVVKVYRIDKEKRQIDVSLKRVSEEEKRNKHEIVKTEKRAEKLLELALTASKVKTKIESIKELIINDFGNLYSCFEAAAEDKQALAELDIPKELKVEITEIAKKNIKKPIVEVSGTVKLVCYGSNGIEDIKKAFTFKEKSLKLDYLGAPNYKISIQSSNYKDGEKALTTIVEHIKSFAQKNNCDFSFERSKNE